MVPEHTAYAIIVLAHTLGQEMSVVIWLPDSQEMARYPVFLVPSHILTWSGDRQGASRLISHAVAARSSKVAAAAA